MARSFWENPDLTFILGYDSLANSQAKSNTLLVLASQIITLSLKFTVALEKSLLIFLRHTSTWVTDMNNEWLFDIIKRALYANLTFVSELKSILY